MVFVGNLKLTEPWLFHWRQFEEKSHYKIKTFGRVSSLIAPPALDGR